MGSQGRSLMATNTWPGTLAGGLTQLPPMSPKIFTAKIFTALADALEWVVRQTGVKVMLHYLDDFLLVGEPASEQCKDNLQKLLVVLTALHIPVAREKLEGPTTRLSFLGIELDTHLMVLRLPQEKIEELRALLAHWRTKKWCLLKDLQSLVGKLQHACKVVRPGRTFLRRMFELLRGTPKRQYFIRLNATFQSDLAWWLMFLESWNGVSMLTDVDNAPSGCTLMHGYFRGHRLWGVVRQTLVSVFLARRIRDLLNSGKGACANRHDLHRMGQNMEAAERARSLR